MATANSSFTGSVPENYDKYLGPFLFDFYAEDITKRISSFKPQQVLEIACGTGIVTKKLSSALPDAKLTASDLNGDMIKYAKTKFNGNPVDWKTADAMSLPFEDETFDAVICQFGLMFVPNKAKAVSEAKRVLKAGGIYIFSTWDSLKENEIYMKADEIVSGVFKESPPEFYKIPFSYYDKNEIENLLRETGFNDIHIEHVNNTGVSESADTLAYGMLEGSPMSAQIKERDPEKFPFIKKEIERTIASRFGNKPVRAKLRALVCTCRK